MTADEVEMALAWAATEGWNPGLRDAACFRAADPEGFLIARREGKPVAVISAVRSGAALGFIGLYIAAPEARGQGHGMAIWRAAMAHLAGRTVGLDGVVAQQANYRKSGFEFAWNNARYQSSEPCPPPVELPLGTLLSAVHNVPFETLRAFDAECYGADRPAFLRAWLDSPGHCGLALVDAGERLLGFGVVRPCGVGCKVGPLFAEGPEEAACILAGLARRATPGPLILDVPEDRPEAVALARASCMAKVFETARMYAGPPPPMRRDRVFGITSFELG
ncbi:MAG: GNAT family N-acetyltransferase [Acetobacteraceae bacterium]|nr:GNAT family N-acetyltransferase [Acetobacteraceae bacterium]